MYKIKNYVNLNFHNIPNKYSYYWYDWNIYSQKVINLFLATISKLSLKEIQQKFGYIPKKFYFVSYNSMIMHKWYITDDVTVFCEIENYCTSGILNQDSRNNSYFSSDILVGYSEGYDNPSLGKVYFLSGLDFEYKKKYGTVTWTNLSGYRDNALEIDFNLTLDLSDSSISIEEENQTNQWYELYLKDKKICEDYSMREIHFEDIDTKEISKIAIIGGGITAMGFKGNLGVDYLFREGTNAYKTETFGVISGGGTVSNPFRYFTSTYQRFAPNWPVVVVENTAKVNEAKNTANSVWGSLKATGVYLMATGKEAILEALKFTYSAPAWLLRGTAFLNISTKLGVGSTIDNKWKVIASKDILSSGADEQSKYWDEVNKAIREGRTSHFYDLGNNGGSTTAIDTTTTQATDSVNTQMQDVNDSLQKIASNIASSTSANTTVQTSIQSAINNLNDTNKIGLQGIQNNISAGTGTGATIDLKIPEGTGIPILTSQLEYLINTTSGLPIQTQPLAQLCIDGLQINADSVKNGIDLNAPKIDDINLKLDSQLGTQLKEMSDNIKINKEKEGKLLDNKIANIPKENDILDNEHKYKTNVVKGLDYTKQKETKFLDYHDPEIIENEDVQGNKVNHSKGLIGGLVALLPGLLNETWTKTAGDNITDKVLAEKYDEDIENDDKLKDFLFFLMGVNEIDIPEKDMNEFTKKFYEYSKEMASKIINKKSGE